MRKLAMTSTLLAFFLAGVLVRGAFAKEDPPPVPVTVAESPRVVDLVENQSDLQTKRRLIQLEEQMRQLQLQRTTHDARPNVPTGPALQLLDPDAGAAADAIWWESKIAEIEEENRDPAWATARESQVASGFEEFGLDAGLRGVRCASTKCNMEIEWPSYAAARAQYGNILHNSVMGDCRRATMMPRPADVSGKYISTVVYECVTRNK